MIKSLDDPASPPLAAGALEVKCTFGGNEYVLSLAFEKTSEKNVVTETWKGALQIADLFSFQSFQDGATDEDSEAPSALFGFEFSVRKLAVTVCREYPASAPSAKAWYVETSLFGNDLGRQLARLPAPEAAVVAGRAAAQSPARAAVSDQPFALLTVGRKAGSPHRWTAISFQPTLRIPRLGSGSETAEVETVSLEVPVMTEALRKPPGLGSLLFWYTRHPLDIPDGFIEDHREALGIDPDLKEPKAKDVKPGLVLRVRWTLGFEENDYDVRLSGRGAEVKPADAGGTAEEAEPASGKEKVDRKVLTVSFHKLGLSVDSGALVVNPQFTCEVGPLAVAVTGLEIDIPVSASAHLDWRLRSLGFSLETQPLVLRGALAYAPNQEDGADDVTYAGEFFIAIRLSKLTISAAALAAYFEDRKTGHKAGFLYVVVAFAKKGGIPAVPFQLTAFALGAGIHYALTIPDIEDLSNFPLIRAATDDEYIGAADDAVSTFDKFKDHLKPAYGTFWGAAGAEMIFYGVLRGFALFILQINDGKGLTDLAILGQFLLQKPFKAGKTEANLIYLELVVKVHVALEAEMAEIRARFTDKSYILDKKCKVRGGLAFCIWWGSSGHSGDWVFTIGGYHPRYVVPAHYPKEQALGIFYQPDDSVVIAGDAYLAITRSAAMVGLRAELSFRAGMVEAWAVLYVDALIEWQPLYLELALGVEFGARVRLGLFGQKGVSFSLGVALALWGPSFGGRAEFRTLGVKISIKFGAKMRPSQQFLSLEQFTSDSLGDDPVSLPVEAGVRRDLTRNTARKADYVVDSGSFELSIKSRIPIRAARLNGTGVKQQWSDAVGLTDCGNSVQEWSSRLDVEISGPDGQRTTAFTLTPILEDAPLALWNPEGKVAPQLNEPEVIQGTLAGFHLAALPARGGRRTEFIDAAGLLRHRMRFAWPSVTLRDEYPPVANAMETLVKTLTHGETAATRHRMLQAMVRQGLAVDPSAVRLSETASRADTHLLSSPKIQPFGR